GRDPGWDLGRQLASVCRSRGSDQRHRSTPFGRAPRSDLRLVDRPGRARAAVHLTGRILDEQYKEKKMAKMPPQVSAEAFAEALRQFQAVVGAEWVVTTDEEVALYRDSYSPVWGQGDERLASAAVAPVSTDQVAAIVRIA